MTQTKIQRTFAPFKLHLPPWLWKPIRSITTALLTPLLFGYRTGFFLSSLKSLAVSHDGRPLPWYTYPSIDFLKYRTYENKVILEFGGGQSTLWWAERAKRVVTFEGNKEWYESLKKRTPSNVELHYVSEQDTTAQINGVLTSEPNTQYDVVVIDGLDRYEMIDIACKHLAADGVIVCDNAEGYGFHSGFEDRGLARVDFYGHAPGVILPHCTSIYFKSCAFAFLPDVPIHVIAKEWDEHSVNGR